MPNCESADARVFVDGEEIVPINQGVKLHVRKNGPASINALAEVWYASEWQGESFSVDALDPTQENVYDTVDVRLRDPSSGDHVTAHRGFVQKAGAGSNGTRERRMVVGGPSALLEAIPFSKYYDNPSIEHVLNEIKDEFEQSQPAFDNVELRYAGADVEQEVYQTEISEAEEADEDGVIERLGTTAKIVASVPLIATEQLGITNVHASKNFTANRDTLRDAIRWLENQTGAYLYFTPKPDGDGIALVYDENPTARRFQARNVGGETSVFKCNALHEISPVNTIEVNGKTDTSISAKASNLSLHGSDKFPSVRAFHPRLRNLAGSPLMPKTQEIDATTTAVAKVEAVNLLKKLIDTDAGGEIITELLPYIRPFNGFRTHPACGQAYEDGPPILYEVEEVTHHVTPSKSTTTMKPSLLVDPNEIEIEQAAMKKA